MVVVVVVVVAVVLDSRIVWYLLPGMWYAVECVCLLSQDDTWNLVKKAIQHDQASRTRDSFQHEQRRMEMLFRGVQRPRPFLNQGLFWRAR